MKIRTQYYQQFDADYSLDVPAEGYGGWQEAELELSPAHTAVVLMHAWDAGSIEEHPGWYRACEEIHRGRRITETVLPPLLHAVRRSSLPLFHVVDGGSYYRDLPGYRRAVALAGPDPEPLPRVAADPVYEHLQRFRADCSFPGRHNRPDIDHGWQSIDFPAPARPLGEEGIAANAHQLFGLCRDAGINHLIYTGFNINWCILMSAAGMVDMARRGLICSVVRQAVDAVENRESARRRLGWEMGLWRTSVGYGFVYDVDDFIAGLENAGART